jgi:anti-sigma-K factor RskA
MIDESKQEILVAYLLDQLDAATAEKVRAELRADLELREFVRQTEDAFASLAYTVPPIDAPSAIPHRILEQERRDAEQRGSARRSKVIWLIASGALAAILAFACIVLSLELTRLRRKVQREGRELLVLRQENQRIQGEMSVLQQKNLLAELKIATLKAQVAAFEASTVVVVWDPSQERGVLQLDKLPPATPGKDYQLWVIDPKISQPVSAGVVRVPNNGLIRATFQPQRPVASVSAFAISVEKAGGVPEPEGQIIFVGM